jgi:hypothetical protein
MGQPINLNKARKAKARTSKEAEAAANRVKFGRTKAEKLAEKRAAERAAKAVDDRRREP